MYREGKPILLHLTVRSAKCDNESSIISDCDMGYKVLKILSPNEKLTHSLTFTIKLSECNLLLLSLKQNALKTFIQH